MDYVQKQVSTHACKVPLPLVEIWIKSGNFKICAYVLFGFADII